VAALVRMLVGKGKAGMVAEVLAEFAAILGSARGGRHLGVCAGHGCSSAPVGARYAARAGERVGGGGAGVEKPPVISTAPLPFLRKPGPVK